LGKRGLRIIGIHTPESEGERDQGVLEAKIKEAQFEFPVAVDNSRNIWNAWGNGIWPSVYLIDKRGYLRYWWYGELKWQGKDGEAIMRQRIEELLAERS
jgi:peroxiredoxin